MLYRRWRGREREGGFFWLRHGGQAFSRGFRGWLPGTRIVCRFSRLLADFSLERRDRCLIMSGRNLKRRSCPQREPLLSSLSGGNDQVIDVALEMGEGLPKL